MQKLNTILNQVNKLSLNTTKDKRQKTKDKIFCKSSLDLTHKEKQIIMCDLAVSDYRDLIDPKFKQWFCKSYYKLGGEIIHQLASEAREHGKDPSRLFLYSIKKELNKKEISCK